MVLEHSVVRTPETDMQFCVRVVLHVLQCLASEQQTAKQKTDGDAVISFSRSRPIVEGESDPYRTSRTRQAVA